MLTKVKKTNIYEVKTINNYLTEEHNQIAYFALEKDAEMVYELFFNDKELNVFLLALAKVIPSMMCLITKI